MHLGVTSRPMDKLTLQADVRYQNKDDQTPLAYYDLAGTMASTNQNLSNRKTDTKVQANWQFSSDYRGSLSANSENIDRGNITPTASFVGISALRQSTRENGVQAELRRLSDDFSGAISLSRSQRDGSNWRGTSAAWVLLLLATTQTQPLDSQPPCSCPPWQTGAGRKSKFNVGRRTRMVYPVQPRKRQ